MVIFPVMNDWKLSMVVSNSKFTSGSDCCVMVLTMVSNVCAHPTTDGISHNKIVDNSSRNFIINGVLQLQIY